MMIEKIRKFKQHEFVCRVVGFQKTGWYLLLLGLLSVVACVTGIDIVAYYIFVALGIFTLLTSGDLKYLLPVLVFPFFAAHYRAGGYSLAESVQVIVLVSLFAAALLARLLAGGVLKSIFTKKIALSGSVIVIIIALALNGIVAAFSSASPAATVMDNLSFGMLTASCLFGGYYIFTHALKRDSGNSAYLFRLFVWLGCVVCVQLIITALLRLGGGTLLREDSYFIYRSALTLGWGNAEVIAGVLLLSLACTLYLTTTAKLPALSYLLSLVFLAGIIGTQTRTAICAGISLMAVGTVVCCAIGRNKSFCRYLVLALVGVAMILFSSLGGIRTGSFFIRILALDQDWHFGVSRSGWQMFALNPIFGGGVSRGGYNNMLEQIAATAGLLGLFGFAYQFGQLTVMVIRRMSMARLFIGLAVVTLLATPLSPLLALLYSLLIAFAERDSDYCRESRLAAHKRIQEPGGEVKPRVAFTFVEAGLGHIMSERAVADAFEKKYGDRVEVVRSEFFTETGESELAATQAFFGLTVKRQSEMRWFGKFLLTLAKIFGDTFAHYFTMEWTPKMHAAAKQGVAHIENLNVDLIFTTHWGSAYYAAKAKNRPFVITLCPDMKSNVMFRVDSNYLLISTKEGYDDLLAMRRYDDSNVKLVPRPIRGQAYELLGKKDETRAELGIDSGAFVVLIADGGYGLAKMLTVTKKLAASNKKLTLIPVAGLSNEIYEKLREIKPSPTVDIMPYGYTEDMLKLIVAADVFVGKSGACLSSETYFYGVPQIITNVATPIERDIMKYCRDTLKSAIYQPNATKAAALVEHFADNRHELTPYSENAKAHEPFGEEQIADLIYATLKTQPKPIPSTANPYWKKVTTKLRQKRKISNSKEKL